MRAVWVRLRRRGQGESGFTLIELLITMILMGVVSTLVVVAVTQAQRIFTHTDDEERGLADAKVVFDRIARDIRESRGVMCDGQSASGGSLNPDGTVPPLDSNCLAHLQLWIDSNSDYVQQPSEIVTWRLEWDPDGIHHDVWRIQGADGSAQTRQLEATSLIVDAVFSYYTDTSTTQVLCVASTQPCAAERVDIVLHYDAIAGRGAAPRTVEASARLRNKG